MKSLLLVLMVAVVVLGCMTPATHAPPAGELTAPELAAARKRTEEERQSAALEEQRRRSAAARTLRVPCDG